MSDCALIRYCAQTPEALQLTPGTAFPLRETVKGGGRPVITRWAEERWRRRGRGREGNNGVQGTLNCAGVGVGGESRVALSAF